MNVDFSKDFEKSVRKLSGKILLSVKEVIQEVIDAKDLDDITHCIRLTMIMYIGSGSGITELSLCFTFKLLAIR